MTRLSTLFAATALFAFAAPASAHHATHASPTSAHHVTHASPTTAHHVADDQRTAEGDASTKILGSFIVQLDDKEKKELADARAKAEAAPESEQEAAKVMLAMMEAITKLEVTFTKDSMTMGMGDRSETAPYTISESTVDTVKLTTVDPKKGEQTFHVSLTATGIKVSKEGDDTVLNFARK